DVVARSSLVLTNMEPVMEFAFPTLKKVIDIGGIVATKVKPLNEHWNSILSLRSRSILISFGSIARSSTLSIETKRGIVKALSNFHDITFIWKYETPDDQFASLEVAEVKNVVLSAWTPQNDLLSDSRVVGFVSHAGAGSVMEAATAAVPTIFVPLFAEQPRNAAMMEKNGVAVVYDKNHLHDTEKLTEALRNIIESKEMGSAATRMSLYLSKRPFSPRELLVKNVEFIAATGTIPSFHPDSIEMSFVELHNLDIIALFFFILLIISLVIFRVLKKIL
ncbi:hypothetical protein PFISCL1PPCAC_6430, partial [Pristionchus fissidentatus]